MTRPIRLMCVDDNELIAEAIRRRLGREADFEWLGWLARASELPAAAERERPDVVVLDVDIPGDDSFAAIRQVARTSPSTRVVMLSGHARREYVDQAVASGAWGYVLKSDGTDAIIDAIRAVANGRFVLDTDSLFEFRG